jgi:hypothetical protein
MTGKEKVIIISTNSINKFVVAFFEHNNVVLSFVLTQKERTKEKVKTDEKYEIGDII